MSLNESSATALVRFTGLGIICFNPNQQRVEVAAIRDHRHAFTLRIQKGGFLEGVGNDALGYQDIAAYEKLPNQGVRIEIRATGAGAIQGYQVYENGNFDRLDSPDANDFRWLVNLTKLHSDTSLKPLKQAQHHLAKIYIGNGLFYTHRLDKNLFFEKVERDQASGHEKREVFGNVGETMGAKILGDEVVVTVRIGQREEIHVLPRVEGLPHRIDFRNMDPSGNAVFSDMADYYGYISSADGSRFDFTPVQDTDASDGGSVNQIEFCHPIVTDDVPSIDDLPQP